MHACPALQLTSTVQADQHALCFRQGFSTLSDHILAYRFSYPVSLEGRKLPIIASRKPERYSSAAPLTADARQRIVAELVSFPDTITISVSVRARAHSLAGHMQAT